MLQVLRTAFLVLLTVVFCGGALRADTFQVYAAASLKDVLAEIIRGYERETGHTVVLTTGPSSELAWRVRARAPADIFIPASEAWMDNLQESKRMVPDTRFTLAGNRMVLIASEGTEPLDPKTELVDRLGSDLLAMALPDSVPAGVYGKLALMRLEIWEALQPNVLALSDVRAALAAVVDGAAPMGIVYATDAEIEPRVTVIAEFEEDAWMPVQYPAALVAASRSPAAREFLGVLKSPKSRDIFKRYGFTDPK